MTHPSHVAGNRSEVDEGFYDATDDELGDQLRPRPRIQDVDAPPFPAPLHVDDLCAAGDLSGQYRRTISEQATASRHGPVPDTSLAEVRA